ncbi:MAG: hypothetical protein ACFFBQ_17520 [Promethearchaeota archaeon]
MPGFSIWQVFQVFGIVSAWSAKALQDGKITLSEAVELAAGLASLLGIPTDIMLPPDETVSNPSDNPEPVAEAFTEPNPHPKQVIT